MKSLTSRACNTLCYALLLTILPCSYALAEVKVFEKEVEEIVGRNQSQDQVEAFALQKAKRLAVEEAGTYLSSLTVVKNFKLTKNEVTALASGIVQAKIIGMPAVKVVKGVVHVTVRSRIQVDTAVLSQQIEQIMQQHGQLKELEAERQKVLELENQLSSIKSSELKRLEELNAQALALEREREKQRLILEEQGLKARGELKQAEIDRLKKERDMQVRVDKLISEQESARKNEAAAIAAEQDRIKKAQLENEQRWSDLARKSKLAQSQWVSLDDSLSLKQAVEEAGQIRTEIANLKKRMEVQFKANKKNLEQAFDKQIALTKPALPAEPKEKDPFETTQEYNKRIAERDVHVNTAKAQFADKIEKLKDEIKFRLLQSEREYLEQKVVVLEPFIGRLQELQAKSFCLPGEDMVVTLKEPDADNSRFPMDLQYKGKTWTQYWKYANRDHARDFWKTRTYLKAQALFQVGDVDKAEYCITGARVSHPGTKDTRDFNLEKPLIYHEINEWSTVVGKELPEFRQKEKTAKIIYEMGGTTERPFVVKTINYKMIYCLPGTFTMGSSSNESERDSDERQHEVTLTKGFYMGVTEVTQAQWRKVMGENPSKFSNCDDCPVENVSWHDCQDFIRRLNKMEGTTKYRLPTEAEWEYACRAGSQGAFCFGNKIGSLVQYAWYSGNSVRKKPTVAGKNANAWGLYDMHGNVLEWCLDWKGNYPAGSVTDPSGPSSGSHRVVRGGSWVSNAGKCRSANRYGNYPGYPCCDLGFRLSRTP